jgi:cytochrome P450
MNVSEPRRPSLDHGIPTDRPTPRPEDFDPFGPHRDSPFAFLRQARARFPVFWSPRLDAWCITRYDDIAAVLKARTGFTAREHTPRPRLRQLPADVQATLRTWRGPACPMASLDPPQHGRIRAAASPGFRRATLIRHEPALRRFAGELLRPLAARGDFDLISEFAVPYALKSILLVLGVADDDHERFHRWTDQRIQLMTARDATPQETLRACAQGLAEFGRHARALAAERLACPRSDVISAMFTGEQHLSLDEVVAQIPTLITAGYRTTAETLAVIVQHQARRHESWADFTSGRISADDLIEEGLRFDGPVAGLYRTATHDLDIRDQHVSTGQRVLLLYLSGNRDETYFSDPEHFQPGRSRVPHLSFGAGPHFCLGATLARLDLRIALEQLIVHCPRLRLSRGVADVEPVFPFRTRKNLQVFT